jgi:MFS family permease
MPLAAYLSFAADHRRFLSFGFVLAFSSSFGQTYFIGIFGPSVQDAFGLSHTAWGTIYMMGTLGSALLLPTTGRLIDRVDLRVYTAVVCVLLIAACAFMAFVTGPIMLVFAIFLLRQSGQGLMSHVSVTSMARYFDAGRGRAIALATLGFAVGEAILPFLAVLAIAAIGWRATYGGIAIVLGIGLLPTVAWLLRGHPERHRDHEARLARPPGHAELARQSWTRAQVLRDAGFYLLMPGILAPSLILTAMFFHHLNLADAKGWSHEWITGSYGIYALAVIVASLVAGRLVDRFGAARLMRFMLLPLVAGMGLVAWLNDPWSAWPYMILIGINTGVALTTTPALWAELYGVENLGSIRSMATALSVFGSALGPITMGGLMDLGLAIETVCLLFAAYAAIGAILIAVALRDSRPRARPVY